MARYNETRVRMHQELDTAIGVAKTAPELEDKITEYLTEQWGLDPTQYLFTWNFREEQPVTLKVIVWPDVNYHKLLAASTENTDRFKPHKDKICNIMSSAKRITRKLDFSEEGIEAYVQLDAMIPDYLVEILKDRGVVKTVEVPASSYETVECPTEPEPAPVTDEQPEPSQETDPTLRQRLDRLNGQGEEDSQTVRATGMASIANVSMTEEPEAAPLDKELDKE